MHIPEGLTRVAMYLRKSRADLEAEARGEGETLAKHRRALLEIARKYRLNVVAIYEEVASGDRIIDRPEMQRLLHDVREGKYEAVLCMDLDRLGRGNMVDQGLIQDAFKSSGTLIITPRKTYDLTDELDEEWSEFESFMARRELKIITRRLQRGRRLSAAEGKHIAARPPYGYQRGPDLKLRPDPKTAPVVRMIFEWIATGMGRRLVVKRLNEMGIPSPSGSRWEESSITSIVRNEVYIGRIIWGRMRYQKTADGGYKRIKLPRSQWIIHDHAHEPLVSEELFHRAREALRRRLRYTPQPNTGISNPLAGLVYCSLCGKAMMRQPRRDRPNALLYCRTNGCPQRGALLPLVEQRILMALQEMVASTMSDEAAQEIAATQEDSQRLALLERQIADLEQEIEQLHKQKDNLHDLLERGIYDVDTYLQRNQVIGERLETAQKRLEELREEHAAEAERQKKRHELVPRIKSVIEAYWNADTEQKNRLLKSVIERVIYTRTPEMRRKDEFVIDIIPRIED